MLIQFRHSTYREPGSWKPTSAGKKRSATVICPYCIGLVHVNEYDEDERGKVTASIECPHENCNFDQEVLLDDWKRIWSFTQLIALETNENTV